jgi:hypothetical protein
MGFAMVGHEDQILLKDGGPELPAWGQPLLPVFADALEGADEEGTRTTPPHTAR